MSDDVPIGCILWLHPRQQAQHDDIPGLDDNVFKLGAMGLLKPRPCVVIDRLPERSGWVKICCLYSFGNRGIENSDRPKEEWRYHVPVYPTPLAWSQTVQLELEEYVYGSRKNFRSSYVNSLKSPDVPVAMLAPYKKSSDWTGVRLCERSFDLLQGILELPLPYVRLRDLCLIVAESDKRFFGPVAQSDIGEDENGEVGREVMMGETMQQTRDMAISSAPGRRESAYKTDEEQLDRHHGERSAKTQQSCYTTAYLSPFSTTRLRKEMAKRSISEWKDKQEMRRELSVFNKAKRSGALSQTAAISGTKSFSEDELAAFSQSKLRREMKRSGLDNMKSGERMREELSKKTWERNERTTFAQKCQNAAKDQQGLPLASP